MREDKQFAQICEQKFEYLTTEYGLTCIQDEVKNWGFEKRYKNEKVGVIITFEAREFYLFVKIARLVNGLFAPEPGEIRPDSVLQAFDLDDIVTQRARQDLIPAYSAATRFDALLFEHIVAKQAENLKLYASDILNGDFSLFPKMEVLVKERAKKAAIQKWGERAVEFGW